MENQSDSQNTSGQYPAKQAGEGGGVPLGNVMQADSPPMAEQEKAAWYKRLYDVIYNLIENPEKGNRQIYQFLPAALEVQETPPSPIGRAIVWLIMTFFVLAVIWAFFGRVDIVAVAQGKIIPSGRVKTIQPLEIGSVSHIHIAEGQAVKAGDALITLDSTVTTADTVRLSAQLADTRLALSRQQVFQRFLEQYTLSSTQPLSPTAVFERYREQLNAAATGSSLAKLTHNERMLQEEMNEYLSRVHVLKSELKKRQAEREGISASIVKLERTLPMTTERAESLHKLMNKQMVAKMQYLELEQQRISEEQDLLTLRAERRELTAAIEEIDSQLLALLAESQKNNLNVMAESLQQVEGLQQELVKAEQRNKMQVLYSPIDGTVQQLAVHTVGGVVTPAQQLMLVVPEQTELEVEAFLLNRDIGFVWEGQEAEVKIDTFNFTKYGTIDAEVLDISNDAVQDEELGLVYLTKVLLKNSQILVKNKWVNLSPGMSVTVEVKTGKRRVIEYFLSPLLRYKQESIRER